eukprot:4096009-Alexandrium_andersonii.AAC.1
MDSPTEVQAAPNIGKQLQGATAWATWHGCRHPSVHTSLKRLSVEDKWQPMCTRIALVRATCGQGLATEQHTTGKPSNRIEDTQAEIANTDTRNPAGFELNIVGLNTNPSIQHTKSDMA